MNAECMKLKYCKAKRKVLTFSVGDHDSEGINGDINGKGKSSCEKDFCLLYVNHVSIFLILVVHIGPVLNNLGERSSQYGTE